MSDGIPITDLLNLVKADIVGWINEAIAAANVDGITVNSISTIVTTNTVYDVALVNGQQITPSNIIVNNSDSGSGVGEEISFANNGAFNGRWRFFQDTTGVVTAFLEVRAATATGLTQPIYVDSKNGYLILGYADASRGGSVYVVPGYTTGISATQTAMLGIGTATPESGLEVGTSSLKKSYITLVKPASGISTPTAGKIATAAADATGGSIVLKIVDPAGSITWVGLETLLPGALSLTGDISPTQIAANTNDYAPTGFATAAVLRLTTDASRDLTGLAGGADGRTIFVFNVGSFNLVLKDESGSSSAANRFALDGDLTLSTDTGATLIYDSTSSRWRLAGVGKTAGGSFTTASTTEVLTGTDTTKGVTADALAALWEQGADVASAGTISLGEGGYFNITGTTTITDIDFATDKAGRVGVLKFAGILTLTHSGSTLILPTGANITTAAGDIATFVSEGSDVVRCTNYLRASGNPLAVPVTVKHIVTLSPLGNETPASAYATFDTRNGHPTLDFDGATDEEAVWTLVIPAWYAGGGLSVDVFCSFTSATSGSVRWQGAIERMDASTLDIDADSFTAFQSVGGTAPGTSGMLIKVTLTFTSGANMDSAAAGEMIRLKIRRDADGTSGTDDITTDAELLSVVVRET